MRVTQATTYRRLQTQIDRAGARLEDMRTTVASGKKLNKPSDDPSAIRPVLNGRSQLQSTDRYLATMGTSLDRLQSVDTEMEHVENLLVQVKELSINSINGTLDAGGQRILADQISQLRDSLLASANASVDGKYLFSGFEENTQPFAANPAYTATAYDPGNPATYPVLYQVAPVNSQATSLEISPGEKVQVNVTGNALFLGDADNDGVTDPGGVDLFAVLTRIEEAMRADNPAGVSAELATLDAGADQNRLVRGRMGNIAQRVEESMNHMEYARGDLEMMIARYEDADIVQAITEMTKQETALQAALNVTAKVSQISILDYL